MEAVFDEKDEFNTTFLGSTLCLDPIVACEDDAYVNFNVPSFVGPAIPLRDKATAIQSWKEMTAVGYERFL